MNDLPNPAIADALEELGDLYQLDGAVVHRVLAYRNAARSVREATAPVAALAREGRATELPGIGATIQEKILALLQTGSIPAAERLREKFPAGLVAITRLPGIGPKRARLLHDALGIATPEELRAAARAQRLRTVRGLGAGFESSVLAALESGAAERRSERILVHHALEIAETIRAGLLEHGPPDVDVAIAGSIRRSVEAVKDLDLVATTTEPAALASALERLEPIASVAAASPAGARARTYTGMAIELRIGAHEARGDLLQHLTGSAAHNASLRERAVRRGLHVSEYSILDDASGASTSYASEEQVYGRLGYAFIPPELREDRGELDAAAGDGSALPVLIEREDIRGDLHCHTVASDGRASIEEMAQAAKRLGYEYLAITDHSASHGFGNAVSPDELRRQIERVREADAAIDGIALLAGSEVNILPDGSLDYDDDLLAELDWVIASAHTAFRMGADAMTARLVAATRHPLVDAIGHPTGRLIERRAPYALDVEALIAAAVETGTLLEINANPRRRDLSEVHARAAAAAGAMMVIDSDAHGPETLPLIRWGIATARRAWLSAANIANTRPLDELRALSKRGRPAAGAGAPARRPGGRTPSG